MNLSLKVRKDYDRFRLDVDINVSGDHIGVFGASGCGKSTLVGIFAGLVKPDYGEIMLDGEYMFSSTKGIDLPAAKRRIALVFQQHELFAHLNVKNNLLYGYKRCAPKHRRIDFNHLIEVLQIGPLLNRKIDGLSGGEKQRVAIGRAVLSNPRLLLLDEPLSALDDSLRFQIISYLKKVSVQFTIPYLFISHSLVEMRLMTAQVLAMSDGKVVEQTATEQLARSRMGQSRSGYTNLLKLNAPSRVDELFSYPWGDTNLLISDGVHEQTTLFELSSKDIILFKKHPEAISARNLLKCVVVGTFISGNRVGIELACGKDRLIAEIVTQAAKDLEIVAGSEVYAAIKASAFRKLGQ